MKILCSALSQKTMISALEVVHLAKTENARTLAVIAAAELLQHAIAQQQSAQAIALALSGHPDQLTLSRMAVIDRAVSVTRLEDGAMLGLWLIPVAVASTKATPSLYQLDTTSVHGLKALQEVQEQLRLTETGCWLKIIPTMFSAQQFECADLSELVMLARHAQEVVEGTRGWVKFCGIPNAPDCSPGVSMYYIPLITCHAAGIAVTTPTEGFRVTNRLTKWAYDSMPKSIDSQHLTVTVAPIPYPMSLALKMGEKFKLKVGNALLKSDIQSESLRPVNNYGLALPA